jgi:hypothetical protein
MRRVATALLAAGALLAAAPATAGAAQTQTAASGSVAATLTYTPDEGGIGATGVRIAVTRGGVLAYDAPVDPRGCKDGTCGPAGEAAVAVTDLDADGEPEVIVDMFSGGAHCCWSTVVFVPKDGTYKARLGEWGNASYVLKDLDGNGQPEFFSGDDAFSGAFTAYAGSYRPPRILALIGQKLRDVTRNFPSVISEDITEIDKLIETYREDGDLRGLIAARMADLALLGRSAEIVPYLDMAIENGEVNAKFKRQLLKFLRKTGYIE